MQVRCAVNQMGKLLSLVRYTYLPKHLSIRNTKGGHIPEFVQSQFWFAERCKLIINMDVPEESSYMQFLTETDPALPTHAIVTFVTPAELITLKNFTQPNPEWKVCGDLSVWVRRVRCFVGPPAYMTLPVMLWYFLLQIKPLPEVLPRMQHDVEEDQQRSCAQPSCMPEGLAGGSMHTGQTSEESAQGQEKPQSTAEELQIRKERLLQSLDVLGSQQTGSSQPAAIPATNHSGQNGHNHVDQEEKIEDEVPPPPLGSPRAPQATAAANTGTVSDVKLHEPARGAASGGFEKIPSQAAAQELDRPLSAYPAASEGAGVHLLTHLSFL